MNKVIFLDRDGVINKEIGDYVFRAEDFVVNNGVIEFLKEAKQKGYSFIIISNQGGIGRGRYSKADVEKIHSDLLNDFAKEGIFIDEIYYCPHHPVSSNCLCRKPASIMIEKAIARFDIDIKSSFLIGDAQRDVEAAEKAGIQGIKIEPNSNLNENRIIKSILKNN